MRSYLMMRDFQLKGVYATTSYLEVRVAIMGRDKVVPLHMWGAGRRGPHLDGRMGYHEGAIFHSEGFPVWEWLLLEILANLAEQWRALRYSIGENLVGHRYLRTIWWLSEGVPMDALMTPDEQVEWDGKWALLWANSGFRRPVLYPDYTKHVDVWWDFDRSFVEAA